MAALNFYLEDPNFEFVCIPSKTNRVHSPLKLQEHPGHLQQDRRNGDGIDWTPPDLFEGMPQCEDGHFRISDRPGHGLALARGAGAQE